MGVRLDVVRVGGNATVNLDTTAYTPDLTLWPEFHNGVAAGLR